MGLYGILLVTSAVSALALVLAMGQYSGYYSSAAIQLSRYSSLQNLEAFSQMVAYTANLTGNQTYGSWLTALEASSSVDGINMTVRNGTVIADPVSYPGLLYIHAVAVAAAGD